LRVHTQAPLQAANHSTREIPIFENAAAFQKCAVLQPLSNNMATAVYLPVLCEACGQMHLQAVQAGEAPSCRGCGGQACILPGQTYSESDVQLFGRIVTSLASVAISRRAGEEIVAELRNVALRTKPPESVLLRVVDFLPTLHFLLPALRLEPTTDLARAMMTRASGMVLSIVTARLRELEGARAH
jgi:hypothetical protein